MQIYFEGFDAICDPMLNPTSKPQVWHGGGFARAAHWIYPPPPGGVSGVCESRVQLVQYQNYKPYLMVPGGPPRALKWPRQLAGRPPVIQFFDLSWPSEAIFGHLSPNMLPRSSQLDAKIAQESPTCGQDRPKSSPRASNQNPQDPKM